MPNFKCRMETVCEFVMEADSKDKAIEWMLEHTQIEAEILSGKNIIEYNNEVLIEVDEPFDF